MKHGRVTAGSFAALSNPRAGLSLLAVFAVSLTGALPARGAEVPFTEHVITEDPDGGGFGGGPLEGFADGARSVFAVDMDGDGDTDVLSASVNDGKIAWYENDGGSPSGFTERVISSTTSGGGALSVFAIDMDGDGDIDVLSSKHLRIAWYENDGGSPPSFTEWIIFTTGFGDPVINSVFAIDVDGDGDTDVLAAFRNADMIKLYISDGGSPPTFTERTVSTTTDGAISVFAADVDGDGDIDVLSASQNDDKIAWHENDGGSPPTFTERVISTAAAFAQSVFATDVDGDGDIDVLSASIGDDKIAWYENDGGSPPSFTERVVSTTADGPVSVFATDVDGDGDTDVLSASPTNSSFIAWYENDGGSPPSFTERVISTTPDAPLSVFATDVDGDGDIDVLSASQRDDKIAWYENTTPPPPIPAVSTWGVVIMLALVIVAGSIVFRRVKLAA